MVDEAINMSYEPVAAVPEPPPVYLERLDDWYVFAAVRRSNGGFSKWKAVKLWQVKRWAPMRPGAYYSIQAYPDQPVVGRCKGTTHHSLFWLEFDGPNVGESSIAAMEAIAHLDRIGVHRSLPDPYRCFTIRYSGNRSIHLGIDLFQEPGENLTAIYRRLAEQWTMSGRIRHADLRVYTEPRLLSCPGSVRFDNGRRILVLTIDELVQACVEPERLIERAEREGLDVERRKPPPERSRTSRPSLRSERLPSGRSSP